MADVNDQAGTGTSLKRKREVNQGDDCSDEEPTVFPCDICSATFVTRISLTRHMILHEDDQVDRQEESSQFDDMELVHGFLKVETTLSEDPYDESTPSKVPKLQKTSKPLPNLKPLPPLIPKREFELAQAHAQMKTHRCDMCSVYFGKKEDLARHITRTHGGARFTCPYCSRNISRRDHLKRHIKNVHPEICTDTEIGPFLADPNASRAAKEQHAENFIAQYGTPQHHIPVGNPDNDQNISPQLQQFNDEDLYEEGDEEFEGEDEPEMSADGMQQITIEPELPLTDDYDVDDQQKYGEVEDDTTEYQEQQQEDLFDIQHLIVQNPVISINDNPLGVGSQIKQVAERKFKCEMCDAAFMSKINLQRHLSTHSIIRPHKCSLCGKGFLRKEHLTKHLSSVHSGMKFTCQFCGKDISRKDHLLRHIRNCHPVEFMGMPAEFIQSEMSQPIPRHAENSILGMQLTAKQSYISCDICFETFNHIDELHEHQSSVHSDVRKYKCPNCPKAFKRKEHLVKHEVLHSGEKKFGCSICKKVFPRKDAVHDHIRRVHSQAAPLSNHPCNLCDNVFQQQAHLRQHLKTYHGVSNTDDDFRNLGEFGMNGNIPVQSERNYNATNSKRDSSAKYNSNRKEGNATSDRINKGLGSLMGLINKGSLSLSRVASTGLD